MNLLQRYLLRQNLVYLCGCLLACMGVYLLIDVFDRLDFFLGRDAGLGETALYFLVKLPLILSQILPGVFLLAMIVHLGVMQKYREIMALEAGGVPFSRLVFFFLFYALFWSLLQLLFSQVLGVAGEIKSDQIWDSAGQKDQIKQKIVKDLWFKQGSSIIHVKSLQTQTGQGQGLKVYVLNSDFKGLQQIVQAEKVLVKGNKLELNQVMFYNPPEFSIQTKDSHSIDLDQSFQAVIDSKNRDSPEKMSLWQLGRLINVLQDAGTNVQHLRTAWHLKLSYAFSIPVLALLALAVNRTWGNMFLNISLGLLLTFIFYMLYVLGGSLGEKRILSPILGAWLGNYLLGLCGLLWLSYKLRVKA